jgi:hypothetical protein
MPQRRFPRPWRLEPIPGGYRVTDAQCLGYAQAPDAIAFLDKPLTDNEASQWGAQMAQRENNDRNKHISRAAKSGRFSRSVGRLIVFSGLLLSAVGLWIYLFNQSPALLEMGLAIVGMGVLITASARFWDR